MKVITFDIIKIPLSYTFLEHEIEGRNLRLIFYMMMRFPNNFWQRARCIFYEEVYISKNLFRKKNYAHVIDIGAQKDLVITN